MSPVKYSSIAVTLVLSVSLFAFCDTKTNTPDTPNEPLPDPGIKVNTIITGRGIIWGMDFLPGGDIIFTEKTGKVFRHGSGTTTEITGFPEVRNQGQGGLLDIRVHPSYASNGWIYTSYSGFDANRNGTLVLARFKLAGNTVSGLEILYTANTPPNTWSNHYGSRIAFDNAGMVYLSVGEGGSTTYGGANSPNMNAQNVQSGWGKVHRMTADGKVPPDNPILPGNSAPTTVYTYGHRNPQGLLFNSLTNQLMENEHGPKGGDEVNIIQAGRNYGWPLVSYGVNYDGTTISGSPTANGIEAPIHTWTPSIGACGIEVITSDKFKAWKGHILVGALALQYLSRLEVVNGRVNKEIKMLENIGRVRAVRQGPDGNIYVSVEAPGRILQLVAE
jgi:glucose/arabinose dehydrogenase